MKRFNVVVAFVVPIVVSGHGIAFPAHDAYLSRNDPSTIDRGAPRPLMLAEQGTAGKGILLTPVPGLSGDGKWTMPAPAPAIAAGRTPAAAGKPGGAGDPSGEAAQGEASPDDSPQQASTGSTVFANGGEVTHKGSGDAAVPGPTANAKTPSSGEPVPVPYPNIGGKSNDKAGAQPELSKGVPSKGVPNVSTGPPLKTKSPSFSLVKPKMVGGTVKAQGRKSVYGGSMTGHNGSSANVPAGNQLSSSPTKVKVAP